MSRHFAIWLAWPILALSVVLTALGLILFALTAATPVALGWGFRGQAIVFPLVFTPIGTLLAVRRPANPIGWIFCAMGLAGGFMVFAQQYAVYSVIAYPGSFPLAEFMAWILNWIWIPAFIFGIAFLLLLFPDGRLLSPRWRFVVWLAIFTTALPTLARAFIPGSLENFPAITNPLGIVVIGDSLQVVFAGGLLLATISMFLAALSLILRFRRAQGTARQQIKWVAYAAALLPVAYILSTTLSAYTRLAGVILILSISSIPIAVGIAILRSNLYDIDIIINRTLVYSVLTLTLGLMYVGCIVLSRTLIAPLTGGSDVAIVASTLAIAALFNPLRRRIQNLIDKRFYRRKYDAARTLAAFSIKMRDATDLDTLTQDLLGVIDETLQPAQMSLWLRQPGSGSTPDGVRPAYTTEPITLTVVDHQ
jgi:hypothetical protein